MEDIVDNIDIIHLVFDLCRDFPSGQQLPLLRRIDRIESFRINR